MVEDSPFFGGVFRKQLEQTIDADIDLATSFREAQDILAQKQTTYDAAILDFNLPDAADGEIVPLVVSCGIPAIVFTANLNDDVRKFVWKHKVVDYVLKSNASSLDYLASLLIRLNKNKKVKILVVDDSSFFRKVLADLLEVHQVQVLKANGGREALAIIKDDPTIQMVITDYNMPDMDGMELTQNLRQKFARDKLAIIGVSSEGDAVMAARFIKSGANDFIIKQSFLPEEFYCRVNQNLDALDHVLEIQEAAIRDHLTGLYNRRHFFDVGTTLFMAAKEEGKPFSCAMIDIDFFKKVNDVHGHHAGDLVLTQVAQAMVRQLRGVGVLARMGGEEFCVLLGDMDGEMAHQFFDQICKVIAATPMELDEGKDDLYVTVSIGVSSLQSGTLDDLVNEADLRLYAAKEGGRNQVVSQ